VPIDSATIRYLLPELLLVVFAICVFVGGTWNRTKVGWTLLAVAAFGLAALILAQSAPAAPATIGGVLVQDSLSQGLRGCVLLLGALFLIFSTQSDQPKLFPEMLGLLVLVFVGLMIVCSAGDLVLLFVGLELISIPTYALLFIGRNARHSDEATAKYFFLSILSSAMLLYGFASLYGIAGSTNLATIAATLRGPAATTFPLFFPVAVGLILVGFCFRLAAVPVHFYAPDVYQSTTNLNAALLAVVPKIAGVVGLVRVLVYALPHESAFAWKLIIILSIMTMTLGNVAALWQSDFRRLMAYSSIAHAGYLMLGLAAAMGAAGDMRFGEDAIGAMLFYVVVYGAATLAAFAAVAYLSDDDQAFGSLASLAGVGRSYPAIGGVIAIAMFSLSGMPPLAGFWGKLALFRSALEAGFQADDGVNPWFVTLAILGVLNAATAAGYYLRVIGTLYFQGDDSLSVEPVEGNAGAGIAALASALIVVAVGIFAGSAMSTAQSAASQVWSAIPPVIRWEREEQVSVLNNVVTQVAANGPSSE
jgi:NADH-quinone oxidoreductase subunit N